MDMAAGHVFHRQHQQGCFLARWISISQKTAWRMGHAIRLMMVPDAHHHMLPNGIVELDEKYYGSKPRFKAGVRHKQGKGTDKQ